MYSVLVARGTLVFLGLALRYQGDDRYRPFDACLLQPALLWALTAASTW